MVEAEVDTTTAAHIWSVRKQSKSKWVNRDAKL